MVWVQVPRHPPVRLKPPVVVRKVHLPAQEAAGQAQGKGMAPETPEVGDPKPCALPQGEHNHAASSFPVTHAFCGQWLEDRHFMPVWLRRVLRWPLRALEWISSRLAFCGQWLDERHSMPAWLKRLSYALLQVLDYTMPILLGLVVAIGINAIEPFGLGNATKAHSQRISARLVAPFYNSQAQDHVAVVLIDDGTLQARGMAWPPRYAYYEEMLRRILAHQPRAVFVDVLLEERRDYDDSFAAAQESLTATLGDAGIPVYFGVSAPGRQSIFSASGARNVVTSWHGTGSAYPLDIGEVNALKPAGARPTAGPVGVADSRSVALALYRDACPDAGQAGCTEAGTELGPEAELPPMAVRWGFNPPVVAEPMREHLHGCLADARPGWRQRSSQSLQLLWDSFRSGAKDRIEDDKRQECAYTLTVFEEQLDGEALLGDEDAGIGPLLKDRVVLVGTHLIGLNDRVLSPVHQQIPGVYLHAMALDNLMHWGRDYTHPPSRWKGIGVGLLNAVVLSAVCGMLMACFSRAPKEAPARWPQNRWVQLTLLFVALAATGIVLSILFQRWLRMPPGDWIGMVLMVFGLSLFVHGLWRKHVLSGPNGRRDGTANQGRESGADQVGSGGMADAGAGDASGAGG